MRELGNGEEVLDVYEPGEDDDKVQYVPDIA